MDAVPTTDSAMVIKMAMICAVEKVWVSKRAREGAETSRYHHTYLPTEQFATAEEDAIGASRVDFE